MSKKGFWILVLLAAVGIGAYLWVNSDRRSDEQIALDVTREWTTTSVDNISNAVAGLLVGQVPILKGRVAGALGDQIRNRVTWTSAWPSCSGTYRRCEVLVTARADIRVPVINQTATVAVPFDLNVDAGDQRVVDWDLNVGSASVSGIELGGVLGSGGDLLRTAGDVADTAGQAIKGFLDDEETQQAIDDTWEAVEDSFDTAREGFQDFMDDEETQQAIDDTWEAVEDSFDTAREGFQDFMDDENTRQALDDTRKAVEDAFGGLFGR